jgi:HEAT repeats
MRGNSAQLEEAIGVLAHAALGHPDPAVRMAAVEAAARAKVVPACVDLAAMAKDDPDQAVREAATAALAGFATKCAACGEWGLTAAPLCRSCLALKPGADRSVQLTAPLLRIILALSGGPARQDYRAARLALVAGALGGLTIKLAGLRLFFALGGGFLLAGAVFEVMRMVLARKASSRRPRT